jgi:F0F1-type ATP synthase membrane subunit b/b'
MSEELLREELSEQQAQLGATLRSALQEQQQQGAAAQAELQSRVKDLQAAVKALEAATDSKVRGSFFEL